MSDHGFQRIARGRSLSDEVTNALRRRLETKELRPGDRLPTEAELAEAFGVSRPVVREAIARLKYDGLIETQQGVGVFVSRDSASRAFRLGGMEMDDQVILSRIFELRLSIEAEATRLAAQRRSDEQLSRLELAVEHMAVAVANGTDGASADQEFHHTIMVATGNALFLDFWEFLSAHIQNSITIARQHSAQISGLSEEAHREHVAILRAIKSGSPERARKAMVKHITSAGNRLGITLT